MIRREVTFCFQSDGEDEVDEQMELALRAARAADIEVVEHHRVLRPGHAYAQVGLLFRCIEEEAVERVGALMVTLQAAKGVDAADVLYVVHGGRRRCIYCKGSGVWDEGLTIPEHPGLPCPNCGGTGEGDYVPDAG